MNIMGSSLKDGYLEVVLPTPLKTFCFLIPSALRWCGGGWWWQGLTDGWPISTQTTAAALFSSTPSYALYYPPTLFTNPTYILHCTTLFHTDSRLYRSKYALWLSKAGPSSDRYSPSTPTPQHSAYGHLAPCTVFVLSIILFLPIPDG